MRGVSLSWSPKTCLVQQSLRSSSGGQVVPAPAMSELYVAHHTVVTTTSVCLNVWSNWKGFICSMTKRVADNYNTAKKLVHRLELRLEGVPVLPSLFVSLDTS